ncbi:MAG: hypothetical protein D6767_03785 [Candidatus Hydrogenedentota bacterium]|nr:MAG: hypothetical protein D6767_03785 [Candidatus Hydrogenedentota bacterium]
MKDLAYFEKELNEINHILIISAGASFDLSLESIQKFLKEKSCFVMIADSMAEAFFRLFKDYNYLSLTFSVERKFHCFLKGIKSPIAFYAHGNLANLPRKNSDIYFFNYLHDKNQKFNLKLISPGTVTGTMIAYALYLLQKYPYEVDSFGVDFAFPAGLYGSKYGAWFLESNSNRFFRKEGWHFEASLSRSYYFMPGFSVPVKTSEEFKRSKENIKKLFSTVHFPLVWRQHGPFKL